jgi:hypothetical protein
MWRSSRALESNWKACSGILDITSYKIINGGCGNVLQFCISLGIRYEEQLSSLSSLSSVVVLWVGNFRANLMTTLPLVSLSTIIS